MEANHAETDLISAVQVVHVKGPYIRREHEGSDSHMMKQPAAEQRRPFMVA